MTARRVSRVRAWAATLAFVLTPGCIAGSQIQNPFPPSEPDSPKVHIGDAVRVSYHGFEISLDPTVLVWGHEARIDVPRVTRTAIARIEARLHSTPVTVAIQAGSFRPVPDIGIGGSTDAIDGTVNITMDQRASTDVRQMLTVWLPMAMAHELHHSKRILNGPGYGRNLLGALVSEGSAEAFARQMYPEGPIAPWIAPLDRKEEASTWRLAQRDLRSSDEPGLHEKWFFGKKGVPRWAGYKIGYAIARAYLHAHPHVTAADLATVQAGEILNESGYSP